MNHIKFLGASGAKTRELGSTCVKISENATIDGGNLIGGLGDGMIEIDTIFLTHPHLDHICDIPFLADEIIARGRKPLRVFALPATIDALKKHIFNNQIWPDFTQIQLPHTTDNTVELIPIELNRVYEMEGYTITAIKTNHTEGSCGYVVKQDGQGIFVTADTYKSDVIWDEMARDSSIHTLCIDVSFPSRYKILARESKHLTPKLLHEELEKLKRNDVTISLMHLKPFFHEELLVEIDAYKLLQNGGVVLSDNDIIYFDNTTKE